MVMDWFNYVGLTIIVMIMIPNVIYSFKHRFPDNKSIPQIMVILENFGRYGSMIFMVFNVPYTWFGFFLDNGMLVYIIINSVLVGIYLAFFIYYWNKRGLAKALFLSVIPSLIFLFSGMMIRSIPLFLTALVFSATHISISIENK